MLSKLAKISNATRAAFILGAVSLLSGCKDDDIAACIQQKTGDNGYVEIFKNGISLKLYYAGKPNDSYIQYYVFSNEPNLQTYIGKGLWLTAQEGKQHIRLHYELSHWYDTGKAEPQRSIIKAIKQCSAISLPDRAPNLK